MSADERARALSWLSSCTDKEFVDFFYEAASSRVSEEPRAFRTHFVLGQASIEGDAGTWSLSVINQPVGNDTAWAPDSPICQEGRCGACSAVGVSWAKAARCAVCGAEVYGT